MPKAQRDLQSELDVILSRIAEREAENKRDRAAANNVWEAIGAPRAKSMLNAKVILNPDVGFGDKRLKALRGIPGTVTSVGRKNFQVTFDGADDDDRGWTLRFDDVVPATPDNLANGSYKTSDASTAILG